MWRVLLQALDSAASSAEQFPATWEDNDKLVPNEVLNCCNVSRERMRSILNGRITQWRQCSHCASTMTTDGCLDDKEAFKSGHLAADDTFARYMRANMQPISR